MFSDGMMMSIVGGGTRCVCDWVGRSGRRAGACTGTAYIQQESKAIVVIKDVVLSGHPEFLVETYWKFDFFLFKKNCLLETI